MESQQIPTPEECIRNTGALSLIFGVSAWTLTFPASGVLIGCGTPTIWVTLCVITGLVFGLVAYRFGQRGTTRGAQIGLVISRAYFVTLLIVVVAGPFLLPVIMRLSRGL